MKQKIADAIEYRVSSGQIERSGDDEILNAIRLAGAKLGERDPINSFLHKCRQIRDAMPQAASIDNFIDAHRDDQKITLVGKLAIARCILRAEQKSSMWVNRARGVNRMDFKPIDGTWYVALFRLLVENCQRQDIAERLSRLTIITFNYDRCIEHYLHEALINYYSIQEDEAREILGHLNIYHPYGHIGPLPWERKPPAIGFGATPHHEELLAVAEQLKTFTEGTDESHSDIVDIRATVHSAKRMLFLGFAFNLQNLQLLYGSGTVTKRTCPVFGSAFGLSPSDVEMISQELMDLGGYMQAGDIHLRNSHTCTQIFNEYGRSLSIR
nr:SIR2 family protein [uncultured Roseateles sp.]